MASENDVVDLTTYKIRHKSCTNNYDSSKITFGRHLEEVKIFSSLDWGFSITIKTVQKFKKQHFFADTDISLGLLCLMMLQH